MTKHLTNRNLTIHNEPKFNDWDVLTNYQLSQEYLGKIQSVLNKSIQQYPRTFVVRVDLHLPKVLACPDYPSGFNTEAITRFIESLKSQIKAQQVRSLRAGKRVHPNTLRYIWAKEQHESVVPHYHMALLFNNDAFFTLGDYKTVQDNLAGRIYTAWARALNIEPEKAIDLVHFPERSPTYNLNANSDNFVEDCNSAFMRLSYLAKFQTKHYGSRTKNFSCSWQ